MDIEIVIKEEDRVYIITDADATIFDSLATNENNSSLWAPTGSKNTLVCSICGAKYREYVHELDDDIAEVTNKGNVDIPALLGPIVSKHLDKLIDADICTYKDNKLKTQPIAFIIATKEKAFLINNYGGVRDLASTHYYGYSNEYFLAADDELKFIENRVERALVSLYQYQIHLCSINFPLIVRDTKTMKTKFYYEKDLHRLYKKYRGGNN